MHNPLKDYIDEVCERRKLGEASLLVLISRRHAGDDPEVQEWRQAPEFLYLDWCRVHQWIGEQCLVQPQNTLLKALHEYMEAMAMNVEGRFTFGEIGLSAYFPELIGKLDRTLGCSNRRKGPIWTKLGNLSIEGRNAVKEWKQAEAYGFYTIVGNKRDFVAAGFAFARADYWGNAFGTEPCPILAFVAIGSEDRDTFDTHNRIQKLLDSQPPPALLDASLWDIVNIAECQLFMARRPLTSFFSEANHFQTCEDWMGTRLDELAALKFNATI